MVQAVWYSQDVKFSRTACLKENGIMMSDAQLKAFVQQSNLIEGIARKPKAAQIKADKVLLDLDEVTIADLAA